MTAAPPSAGPRRPGSVSRPLALLALASGVVLLTVLGLAARITPESPVTAVPTIFLEPPTPPPPPQQTAQPSLAPLPPPQDPGRAGEVVAVLLEVLLALVVLIGVAAVVLLVVLVVRVVARQTRPSGIEGGETVVDLVEIEELLARSRREIDVEGDANLAVVRCWRGLEALAAEAGVPRAASQTAREYTVTVLTDAHLPERPAQRLADLYEGALFSGQQLPESDKRVALQALTELRDAAELVARQQDAERRAVEQRAAERRAAAERARAGERG